MRRNGLVALLLLALLCLALQVQPESVTVDGALGTSFDQVFTLTNDASHPISLDITPNMYSTYLADSVTLSQNHFLLRPQESANIQVRGTVPLLGPEVHRLRYDVQEKDSVLGSFTIRIPVTGTPQLHPQLDVVAPDVIQDEPVSATLTLRNFGNIIAYYNLSMHIRQGPTEIGSLTYPLAVQVLPGAEEELSLLYTDALDPGEYQVEVQGLVNQEQEVRASRPFRVLLEDQVRSLHTGEDIVLSLSGSGSAQTVDYVITENGREVLRDTLVSREDTIQIPTSTLSAGQYRARITVTHNRGSDVTLLTVNIRDRSMFSWTLLFSVFGFILVAFLLRRFWVWLRIAWLTFRVRRAEKQLNMLLLKAHSIGE